MIHYLKMWNLRMNKEQLLFDILVIAILFIIHSLFANLITFILHSFLLDKKDN